MVPAEETEEEEARPPRRRFMGLVLVLLVLVLVVLVLPVVLNVCQGLKGIIKIVSVVLL